MSPQLRALGVEIRLLAVLIDAIAAFGKYNEAVQARLDTALLTEKRGEGWNEDHASRVMAARGWKDAEGIYDAAQIPEKHRRVIDLALWQAGEPDTNRKGYFSLREIADLTGHPLRTVQLWVHDDIPKLKRLDWQDVA
jgi:DNA mismatch repair protein MutH